MMTSLLRNPKRRRAESRESGNGRAERQWSFVEFRFPEGMFNSIRNHMFADSTREQFGILLVSPVCVDGCLRMLARTYLRPSTEDLDYAHYTGIRTTRQYNNTVLKQAVENRLSLVHVHSHPFTDNNVGFSGVDDHSEREEAVWLAHHFPSIILGSIVMGHSSLAARVWSVRSGQARPTPIHRVTALEFPLVMLSRSDFGCFEHRNAPDRPAEDWASRQVQAFGNAGQEKLEQIRIGIVGVGGLGSLLAEGLARLGARRFILIDPDRVDETNRNRLLGLTEGDVRRKAFKVRIAEREVKRVSRDSQIQCLRANAATRTAASALKQCDLVMVATDNHYSRFFLQRLTQQYLIPLVNIGVAITTSNGRIDEIFGGIQLYLPGARNPCLLCSQQISLRSVSEELASPGLRIAMKERGYLDDVGPAPSVRPLNAVTANLALSLVHNLLSEYGHPIRSLSYNMLSQVIEQYEASVDETCPICGTDGITGLGDALRLDYYIAPSKKMKPAEDKDASFQPSGG